ncbi:mycofactocin-coupled SDR family oxidoreductase [Actinocorallia sp. A-T 12471]|uniref:mycofactocin-coupled SDR family oxidoreductase n=1 Tax=Actinocorallia sp. A-T 12471 TaxID=3089813 RepID=UPI0029D216A5|nr:mycofactocin-coupled SDR family oxidoreductase [Actinocorallia sp. A-T 12471]MDX6742149.1 mycofactocin-coupled SDR family oxidoreductase [Actinocorallia sp. A-T 12471]
MGRVEGKVAFVTGAARGQGRSHAVRLAEEGADIIAVDICHDLVTNNYPLASEADLQETARLVEKAGRRVIAKKADVRERAQLAAVLAEGVEAFGKLDVVVANAGIMPLNGEPGLQAWTDVVDTNLVGVINAVHASLPHLAEGGSIVATGSAAAFMVGQQVAQPGANPGGAGYSYAKRALSEFIHEMARNLAPRMIRANAVHPTNCNTDMLNSEPMYKAFRPDLENPTREDALLAFPAQQAMPIPFIEPGDVTNAVVFLASEESRYVTGLQLRVDGGSYLKFHDFHL